MFIFIRATKHNSRWDCEARCEKQIDDSTDKWILNTDYIIGITPFRVYLSRHVDRATQVDPSDPENEPHSFYINLYPYHTVKTEIVQFEDILNFNVLNRTKVKEEG